MEQLFYVIFGIVAIAGIIAVSFPPICWVALPIIGAVAGGPVGFILGLGGALISSVIWAGVAGASQGDDK